MASFPGSKVHRVSRRKLGRGQHVQLPPVMITGAAATTTVTLTFSTPVVVSGNIPLTLSAGGPLLSQSQTSPTTVVQHYTSSAAGATWSIAAGLPMISTFQGGSNAAAGGTF
jgi:hypothetical protein